MCYRNEAKKLSMLMLEPPLNTTKYVALDFDAGVNKGNRYVDAIAVSESDTE